MILYLQSVSENGVHLSLAIDRDVLFWFFWRKIEIGSRNREDTWNKMKGCCGSHGNGTFLRTLMGVMAICHGKKVDPTLPFQMKDLVNLGYVDVFESKIILW